MAWESREAKHPGPFIRKHIIPAGMSVSEAAKRLGVGRPALSNLLNGNSSLSPEMAARLEKAFGADRNALLKHREAFERRDPSGEIVVHPYVPLFLQIKSRQIDAWADGVEARHHLPVLLRLLIVSTHDDLSRVTFPGHDDGQRHGWDGLVEADTATPWIPRGFSYWEFGTSRRPGEKANADYQAALRRPVPFADRRESTFVFVTPRRWAGATDWAAARQREGRWKAVKALDASDLEVWLIQSIPGQVWLAEELPIGTDGVQTLDRFWTRWSSASRPKLMPEVFRPSLEAYRDDVADWLEKEPKRPFVISADSKGEGIAFLACLFREFAVHFADNAILTRSVDLAAVFDSSSRLRTLAESRTHFLPIVHSDKCERELAPLQSRLHCITVRPRNAVRSDPDIALDLLTHETFRQALESMSIDPDRVEQLERESGRSPTILRRRMSTIDSIKTPGWAAERTTARALIPLTLVGAWNGKSPADRKVVTKLANRSYEAVEEDIAAMLLLDDSPVWAVGHHRGVVAKIDALFAISKHFTGTDLSNFFTVARYVLAEIDPALELPEDQRWAAAFYGKVRDHSAALRRGICETFVILAVHGDQLFPDWLEVDAEVEVSSLIRSLLTPLTLDKLLSHDGDLPRYAEAVPQDFLQLIENDLRADHPAVLGLLKPAHGDLFSRCPRTGLLWALESLAWKHLPRVNTILGRLSSCVIDDNWTNKPINSLKAIYRSWMPQTAASLDDRKTGITALTSQFPDVGWQICMHELSDGRAQIGQYSYRPRWRSDATGAGRGVTHSARGDFVRHVLDIVHDWPELDARQLGHLVERAASIPEADQVRIWARIIAWGDAEADDYAKASLREQVRRRYLARRGEVPNLNAATIEGARRTFRSLESPDPVIRHLWLFSDRWVEPSVEDVGDRSGSHSDGQEIIKKQRRVAIAELWETRGLDGVISLLRREVDGDIVGISLAAVISPRSGVEFLKRCLDSAGELAVRADACMRGFLWALTDDDRSSTLETMIDSGDLPAAARLLQCAPFGGPTWRLVERLGQQVEDSYWKNVTPQWVQHDELELTELIDHLLRVKRPRDAFWVASRDWSLVETSRLRRVLYDAATQPTGAKDNHRFERFDIQEGLKSLNGRAGVNPEDMAVLEFLYLDVVEDIEYGLPNLEEQIASSPALYFRALTLAFRRRNNGEDPPEWRIDDPRRASAVASRALRLLGRVRRLPGMDEDGTVDQTALWDWVAEVRRLCEEHDRAARGDEMIGQFLSRIDPVSEDGTWPRAEICEVMERTISREMGIGFRIGVQNARGVHWRGDDGEREVQLATKFRRLAERLAFDYPFVANVLEEIACGYEREARWHETEGEVRRRLG